MFSSGKSPYSTSSPMSSPSNIPTSVPSKWPGVRLLLSLLATENRDNSTRLRVILAEACVAVYLSLLSVAWSTCQPNQLYRLVCNSLKAGIWGKVFGGGVKVAVQTSTGGLAIFNFLLFFYIYIYIYFKSIQFKTAKVRTNTECPNFYSSIHQSDCM